MSYYAPPRDRSLRGQLQRSLGELGTVLPHQKGATRDRTARGWYAELAGGELRFLGDHSGVAELAIERLQHGVAGSRPGQSRPVGISGVRAPS